MQVMNNLLGNAIKFSSSNRNIYVIVREIRHDNHQDNGIKVSVGDEGPGIAKEYLEQIFSKFKQEDNIPRQGRARGTGLGLNISKEINHPPGGSDWGGEYPGKGERVLFYPATKGLSPAYLMPVLIPALFINNAVFCSGDKRDINVNPQGTDIATYSSL